RVGARRGEGDVVQQAVVAAHDDERLTGHRGWPLEDTVDETRITGPRASDESAKQKQQKKHHARGEQSSHCHRQPSRPKCERRSVERTVWRWDSRVSVPNGVERWGIAGAEDAAPGF